jgi:hypothetical protein
MTKLAKNCFILVWEHCGECIVHELLAPYHTYHIRMSGDIEHARPRLALADLDISDVNTVAAASFMEGAESKRFCAIRDSPGMTITNQVQELCWSCFHYSLR